MDWDLEGSESGNNSESAGWEDEDSSDLASFYPSPLRGCDYDDQRYDLATAERRRMIAACLTNCNAIVINRSDRHVASCKKQRSQSKLTMDNILQSIKHSVKELSLQLRPACLGHGHRKWHSNKAKPKHTLTFMLFSRLPPELRTMVWELARPGGRVVKLQWSRNGTPYSDASIPGMLHACFESRKVALRWYSLEFSQAYDCPIVELAPLMPWNVKEHVLGVIPGYKITRRVFFDASNDIIFHACGCSDVWCENCDGLYGSRDERHQLTRLILSCKRSEEATPFFPITLHFPQVQSVLLMDPTASEVTPNTNFSDLVLSNTIFEFQEKAWRPLMNLQAALEDEKRRIVELFSTLGGVKWKLEKVAAVEVRQKSKDSNGRWN